MNVDDFLKRAVNRRQFLGSSAKNAAGVAAGMVALTGATAIAGSKSTPGERVRVATIGVRNQGKTLTAHLAGLPDVDVVALCDVDESLRPAATSAVTDAHGKSPHWETDFRRILDDQTIDAVVIATPDHWHAPMTILACQAGKDVYVEKPVSHNVREGQQMVAAARRTGRVVQSGLQQRSGTHFQSAVDFVRSGKLVPFICQSVDGPSPQTDRPQAGQRPTGRASITICGSARPRCVPSTPTDSITTGTGSGITEPANWATGAFTCSTSPAGVSASSLPTRISASGGRFHFDDDQETPDTLVVQYAYPRATIVWEHRLWSTHGVEGRSAAAAFYGEAGTLVVDRGGWKVYDLAETIASDSSEQPIAHLRNFIDCIKSRSRPAADIETGHVSSALCHLGNIAYRVGREVTFSPEAATFGSDREASLLLSREYRSPWDLPSVV